MDFQRKNLTSLHNNTVDEESIRKSQKSLKEYFQSRDNENRKIKTISKTTQVNLEAWVSDDDLSNELPTESFWKILAEKRRIALEDALRENERLWVLHETLTKENAQNQKLLNEANSFIEVFNEVVQDIKNDSGIEVGETHVESG